MAIPQNDVACAHPFFKSLKPSEKSSYDMKAAWVKASFSKGVHPYANSISGTMLNQLRCFLYLSEKKQFKFNTLEKLGDYLRCFASMLLFNSGGHTFHEFFALLKFPEFQKAFGALGLNIEVLTEKKLLLSDYGAAFDRALKDTIDYNHHHLLRLANLEALQARVALAK